jgi:hypothetical protein
MCRDAAAPWRKDSAMGTEVARQHSSFGSTSAIGAQFAFLRTGPPVLCRVARMVGLSGITPSLEIDIEDSVPGFDLEDLISRIRI